MADPHHAREGDADDPRSRASASSSPEDSGSEQDPGLLSGPPAVERPSRSRRIPDGVAQVAVDGAEGEVAFGPENLAGREWWVDGSLMTGLTDPHSVRVYRRYQRVSGDSRAVARDGDEFADDENEMANLLAAACRDALARAIDFLCVNQETKHSDIAGEWPPHPSQVALVDVKVTRRNRSLPRAWRQRLDVSVEGEIALVDPAPLDGDVIVNSDLEMPPLTLLVSERVWSFEVSLVRPDRTNADNRVLLRNLLKQDGIVDFGGERYDPLEVERRFLDVPWPSSERVNYFVQWGSRLVGIANVTYTSEPVGVGSVERVGWPCFCVADGSARGQGVGSATLNGLTKTIKDAGADAARVAIDGGKGSGRAMKIATFWGYQPLTGDAETGWILEYRFSREDNPDLAI